MIQTVSTLAIASSFIKITYAMKTTLTTLRKRIVIGSILHHSGDIDFHISHIYVIRRHHAPQISSSI
jgi:hypothetical protein